MNDARLFHFSAGELGWREGQFEGLSERLRKSPKRRRRNGDWPHWEVCGPRTSCCFRPRSSSSGPKRRRRRGREPKAEAEKRGKKERKECLSLGLVSTLGGRLSLADLMKSLPIRRQSPLTTFGPLLAGRLSCLASLGCPRQCVVL